jgi:uncharacterized lipoprotein YmbA
MSKIGAGLVLFSALLTAASCAGIPRTHYYVVQGPEVEASDRTPGPAAATVGVAEFGVAPPYDQGRIVYRIGEGGPEVGFYAYHRWAAPLSSMLPGLVASTLGDAIGAEIVPYRSSAAHDAVLTGRLLMLEEMDLPEDQRIRVRLALSLRDAGGDTLWSGVVSSEITIRTKEVEEVVRAMERALRAAVLNARDPLRAALGPPDGAASGERGQ